MKRKISLSLKWLSRKYPSINYIIKWLLISGIISLFIGIVSAFFLNSLDYITNFRENNNWIIYLLPVAGLLVGSMYHYFGRDIEAGNNLLIQTIQKPEKIIPFKMAPMIYLGTIITHLFGGSAGREGTALQMAGAITDQFSKLFNFSKKDRQIILISSVAAGFGSVFGTPFAGAIFAMEFYIIGKIRYNALLPVFLSAVMADIITKIWSSHTIYSIASIPEISFLNIIYVIIAGIIFGLCALLFSKSMNKISGISKKFIPYSPLRAFFGGIIIVLGVLIIGNTKFIGLGIPTIVESFQQQLPFYNFFLKLVFTVITLSFGFKGGEVTPLFFIGATLGNALNLFIPLPLDLLAGIGFVAVFAGATNTPFACSIMAMELFGSEVGVYAAIACIISYLISGNNGIYGKQIVGQAKFFSYNKGKYIGDL